MGGVEGKTRRMPLTDYLTIMDNHGNRSRAVPVSSPANVSNPGPHQPREPRPLRGRDLSIINDARMGRRDKKHWRKFDFAPNLVLRFVVLYDMTRELLAIDRNNCC